MSAKLNNFMFNHEPEHIWNDAKTTAIKTIRDQIEKYGRTEYLPCNGIINSVRIIKYGSEHPFIEYLKQNNIGQELRSDNLYAISFTEIVSEYDDLIKLNYRHCGRHAVSIVCSVFENKLKEYGLNSW